MIIYIPLFQLPVNGNPARRFVTKIKNYDENNILIPSLSGGFYSYRILSAIVHIGNSNKSGHYIIWCRANDNSGWFRISDSEYRKYKSLVANLSNVSVIFLERI